MSSPPWQQRYASKRRTAIAAMSLIKRGDNVFVSAWPFRPALLVSALRELAGRWGREAVHVYTPVIAPGPEVEEDFGFHAISVGPLHSSPANAPYSDHLPASSRRIAQIVAEGLAPLDVALIQVTPPDAHGFCSLGPGVDVARTAAEQARLVIAEVNAQLPWTWGDSVIHVDHITALVEHDAALPAYSTPPIDDIARRIAHHAARLVPDEATLQLGAGPIPAAILEELRYKRDLGLHTGILTEGMMDLIEAGVITNRAKTLHPGKAVASRCLGTQRLYDYIHDNPILELGSAEEVGDPEVVRRNHKMTAINCALLVDLSGWACAALPDAGRPTPGDPSGFPQGAMESSGGLSLVALASQTGEHAANIVAQLPPGAAGLISGDQAHHVVTEHGVADLYGRTLSERALELIGIAAPSHREGLLEEAIRLGYVPAETLLPIGEYPPEFESVIDCGDGLQLHVRPVRPSDERLLRGFFYALSEQSLYYRFFRVPRAMPPELVRRSERIDYTGELTLVGLLYEGHRPQVVAVSRYVVDPATRVADVALLVRDDYQRHGIGSRLLIDIGLAAQRRGCVGLKADILTSNYGALGLLRKSGYAVTTELHEGYYTVSYHFPSPAPPPMPADTAGA